MISETRTQAERALLGLAIRGDESAIEAARAANVSVESFCHDAHRAIWSAVIAIDKAGRPVDLVGVHDSLKLLKVESDYFGPVYLAELAEEAPLSQNVNYWATRVADGAWRQCAADMLGELQRTIVSRDGESIAIDQALIAETLTKLGDAAGDSGLTLKPVSEIAADLLSVIERRVQDFGSGVSRGVSSGLATLDRFLGGFVRTRLYFFAARPGIGKTTLAVNFAAAAQEPWAYFTLEMTSRDIVEKILSLRARIRSDRLQTGCIDENDLDRLGGGIAAFSKMPGHVDNKSGLYLENFETTVRRAVKRSGVKVVFLDYVQQMRIRSEKFATRQQELSEITSRLKQLAMSADIAIVALAQLNRETEKVMVPKNSHLKDSGSIEQDADAIVFIHRDETKDETMLIVSKNRWGQTGYVKLEMNLAFNRITEL